jgi:hypothetical protein
VGRASIAIAPSVSCFRDTCDVYGVRAGAPATHIDSTNEPLDDEGYAAWA